MMPPTICTGQDSCDGRMHYTAVFDDELGRWVPIDYHCPSPDRGER